ncbi:hypothetical protein HDU82_003396, partial [Entophlyctis luteolus]
MESVFVCNKMSVPDIAAVAATAETPRVAASSIPPPAASASASSSSSSSTTSPASDGVSSTATFAPVLILDSLPTGGPFDQKRIDLRLPENCPLKIGRKVTAKHGPEVSNGIFDSKVLSRQHAEIWIENGKVRIPTFPRLLKPILQVWIKDVKSSNGTFVNNTRLSEEGVASDPFQLHTGDVVDFGLDIMNDDGVSAMYKKMSCHVTIWDTNTQGPVPASLPPPASAVLPHATPMRNVPASEMNHGLGGRKQNAPFIKMDTVFAMIEAEIRNASIAGSKIAAIQSDVSSIDSLVGTLTNSSPTASPYIGPAATTTAHPTKSIGNSTVPAPAPTAATAAAIASAAALEADLASTRQKLQETTRALREARELSQPVYRDNEDLRKRRQEAEAELVVVRRAGEERASALEKEIASLKMEVEAAKEREQSILSSSLTTTAAQQTHLASLESEISAQEALNKRLEASLQTVEQNLAAARALHLQERESLLQDHATAAALLKSQIATLESRIAGLEADADAIRAQKREVEAALETEREAKLRAIADAKATTDQMAAARADHILALDRKSNDCEARVRESEKKRVAEIDRLTALLSDAKKAAADKESELQAALRKCEKADLGIAKLTARVTELMASALPSAVVATSAEVAAAGTSERSRKKKSKSNVGSGDANPEKRAADVVPPRAVTVAPASSVGDPLRSAFFYVVFGCLVSFLTYLSVKGGSGHNELRRVLNNLISPIYHLEQMTASTVPLAAPAAAGAVHTPAKRQKQGIAGSIAADVFAAACTAAVTSPVVAIIDRSIISNFSGKQTLLSGLKDGFTTLLTKPLSHIRQPSVLAVFVVYGLTYAATNVTETLSTQQFHIDANLPKFISSSITNTGLTIWKDSLLTKWFGQGNPRPVALRSYLCFGTRDSLTMAAAFTFPPMLSKKLQREGVSRRVSDVACQLMLPCLFQFVTTPVHLLGLDFYNRPNNADAGGRAGRFAAVAKEYLPSTFARMGRILPAFGFGGVINRN